PGPGLLLSSPPRRSSDPGARVAVRAVIEAQHDDRAHLGPQPPRIAAARVGHPGHVAMGALGQEFFEPPACLRRSIGPRDADHIEDRKSTRLNSSHVKISY